MSEPKPQSFEERVEEEARKLFWAGNGEFMSEQSKGFKKGASFVHSITVQEILDLLRSDEAKAVRHCHKTIHGLFGQTGEVLADWIETEMKKRGKG
jgi:hypothetical protein